VGTREFGWTPRHIQNHLTLALNAKHVALPPGGEHANGPQCDRTFTSGSHIAVDRTEMRNAVRKIHLEGQIEEGTLDLEALLKEMTEIAYRLNDTKTAAARQRHLALLEILFRDVANLFGV